MTSEPSVIEPCGLSEESLRSFLEEKWKRYERPDFTKLDPICIPHRFKDKEDIEIAGFFAAIFAWGQRVTIINKTTELLRRMDDSPADYIRSHEPSDRKVFLDFAHRTFNGVDCDYFLQRLQAMYSSEGGLERVFSQSLDNCPTKEGLSKFKMRFFDRSHQIRSQKHIGNPLTGSTAKRLNMFLRWMVRPSDRGVDFGLWKEIQTSQLSIPLDVHTGNVARLLGLLKRTQNDWRAVEELDNRLRDIDPVDPVKFDFALFGLGVDEGWK